MSINRKRALTPKKNTDKQVDYYKKQIAKMGVEMSHANFHKGYSDDEGFSYKGTIADLEFKRDLLRGKDPIDALCDLQEKIFTYQLLNPNPNIYESEEDFDYGYDDNDYYGSY
jgi:hypothetical protein